MLLDSCFSRGMFRGEKKHLQNTNLQELYTKYWTYEIWELIFDSYSNFLFVYTFLK